MIRRLSWVACSAALLLAATVAWAKQPTGTLGAVVADTASHACVEILAQEVAFPADIAGQQKLLTNYGLSFGLPQAAIDESGEMRAVFNRATLAHRIVGNDGFAVALGGAQPTCRLVIYHMTDRPGTRAALAAALLSPALGWKEQPTRQSSPAAERRMFIKRSAGGKPMLLNVISGLGAAESQPVIVTVTAIPAGVQLPEGF